VERVALDSRDFPAQEPLLRPGQRAFRCPVCRFMYDTGERAPECRCNWIECQHPDCPAGRQEPDGRKVRLKSRFCQPGKCRFFEAVTEG